MLKFTELRMHSAKKRDQALIPTLKCAAFPRSVNVGFVKQIHPHATVHCRMGSHGR